MTYAVIFDVDGVLANTEILIARATIAMFRELYGVELTPEDFRPYIGTGAKRYTQGPAEDHGIKIDLDQALRQRQENFTALLQSGESIAFPGASELIEAVHRHPEWKLAIATSSPGEKASATLAAAAIDLSRFDALITGDMVTNTKPNPEIYLTASKIIDIAPRDCVVIEDAPAGVEAAKSAGMCCIAVTNTFSKEQLSAADQIVDSLRQIDLAMLLALVA
ncbi:MAG: HAD-IA family hydrolase [Candidatus Hydrogenedentota bacterium]